MLCVNLQDTCRRQLAMREGRQMARTTNSLLKLERIRGKNDSITRPPTRKQILKGRTVGTANNANCYVCRKYLGKNGDVVCRQTTFYCSVCKMPLCKTSHINVKIGRTENCFEEHMMGKDENTCCSQYVRAQPFPKDGHANLYPILKVYPKRNRNRKCYCILTFILFYSSNIDL